MESKYISAVDVTSLTLGDFLKQVPGDVPVTECNPLILSDEDKDECGEENDEEDGKEDDEEDGEEDGEEEDENKRFEDEMTHYECHNPECKCSSRKEDIKQFHLFEMSGDDPKQIIICGECYDGGYRLCIFSHDVLHLTQLTRIGDGMHISSVYETDLSIRETISKIASKVGINTYLKQIGIMDPHPIHNIIYVN